MTNAALKPASSFGFSSFVILNSSFQFWLSRRPLPLYAATGLPIGSLLKQNYNASQ
jgi:hypothetical protein